MSHGFALYESLSLARLWGKGWCLINDVSFASAAYVARYITKKINSRKAEEHYRGLEPEYITMSQGIGRQWIEKYMYDTYKDDTIIINSHSVKPSRYYDKILKLNDEDLYNTIKAERLRKSLDLMDPERSVERLDVKEQVTLAKFRSMIRSYEADFT
jgi:hypothetical protein